MFIYLSVVLRLFEFIGLLYSSGIPHAYHSFLPSSDEMAFQPGDLIPRTPVAKLHNGKNAFGVHIYSNFILRGWHIIVHSTNKLVVL